MADILNNVLFMSRVLFNKKHNKTDTNFQFSIVHVMLSTTPLYDNKERSYCQNVTSNFDLLR